MIPDIKKGNNRFYIGTEEKNSAEITFVYESKSTILIDHTYVAPELRGRGIASQLVKKVADFAREEHLEIIPVCSFARDEMIGKKEYEDVLAKKIY